MTTITKPSFASRYICNGKFLILLLVSICLIAGGIYYGHQLKMQTDQLESEDLNGNGNATTVTPVEVSTPPINWEENEEIQILQEYLRIPSVHPNIDYEPCIEFLKRQAKSLDLPYTVFYPVNDKNPVFVMTWNGSKPDLPSIMLNSHMDVVPVAEEYWTYPPFAAEIDENGDIYARGVNDIKSIGMQILAAIRSLKRNGVAQLKRTIHVTFVPDEELGGYLGMYGFVQTDDFKKMNVGFMLDEGGLTENKPNELAVFVGERTVWKAELIFHGPTGHGSALLNHTAGEKLSYVVDKFMEMRKIESWKLNVLRYPYGKVTSINLTILKGGLQNNIIPPEMRAIFDLRFSVDADLEEFENKVAKWCEEAGGNITITYPQKEPQTLVTASDDSNPFWRPFVAAINEFNIKTTIHIMPAATDARFIRRQNIPAIGFNAYVNSTMFAHAHNERLNAKVYLFGIGVYEKIIQNVANV